MRVNKACIEFTRVPRTYSFNSFLTVPLVSGRRKKTTKISVLLYDYCLVYLGSVLAEMFGTKNTSYNILKDIFDIQFKNYIIVKPLIWRIRLNLISSLQILLKALGKLKLCENNLGLTRNFRKVDKRSCFYEDCDYFCNFASYLFWEAVS